MLEERNQRSSDRCDLLRRNVHQVYIRRRNDREVCVLTTLDNFTDESTIIIQRGIALSDNVLSLLLGCQVDDIIVIEIGHTILHLTVRGLDKAELINLCIHTK